MGDLAAFSIRQDAALSVCSARGDAVVSLIDGSQPKRKRFWIW